MGKKKSKEKQKKRKGPIQRAAPAQAQDNQSESSSTSRSRSPQLGQSVSNYEEQQPGTSEANDAAPFNNTMNLGFVVTLLNDIKPPALVLIDRDGAGVIKPQSQHHRLTLHDLRVHLQAALDDYEDFVRRGARVGEIAADETDVEDEAAADPSGCNAPSDDVDLDEPGPSNRKMAEYHDWPPPSQIKMGKKKSKEKQKKRKGPIQRAAPAQAQDNQSESSSTSRSRSPQLGQSVSNYEEQQPGTSEANDAAPFNNTMNLGFVVTLLNDIKPPALVLIDRDGAGVIKPQSQHHRLTLHDLRVHLQAALDDYEDFVRRGARVGEIAADETDVEDEAAADPSGCNAPSDDVDLDEPGPSNRKMAEYHDWPPPSQIKMGKKKSKEKQKKRKGPIQRAAPAQAQDNQSESSSTSRSRSPQLGQSVSNYEEQQPGTSEANDAAPVSRRLEDAKFPVGTHIYTTPTSRNRGDPDVVKSVDEEPVLVDVEEVLEEEMGENPDVIKSVDKEPVLVDVGADEEVETVDSRSSPSSFSGCSSSFGFLVVSDSVLVLPTVETIGVVVDVVDVDVVVVVLVVGAVVLVDISAQTYIATSSTEYSPIFVRSLYHEDSEMVVSSCSVVVEAEDVCSNDVVGMGVDVLWTEDSGTVLALTQVPLNVISSCWHTGAVNKKN
ncbi:unnamed protein product [Caenorhabditis brenneri]